MCGISGVFGDANRETVQKMLAAIPHRGPDDGHLVAGSGFTLGARRLSIVDLDGGRQPLCNESGTIWAAQNGELYNYPDVHAQLLKKGHVFRTKCDTELLPHLYEEYGSRLPEHLDGMFAIAVFDTASQTGFLARDRMGKKPLYYCRIGDCLYFASEIKCLLQIPGISRRLNVQALSLYFSYKHVPSPLTIFENIFALPPAHKLTWRAGQDPLIEPYWHLSYHSEATDSIGEAEAADRLLELLKAGVKKRFMSDVPLGFFLSGGIDSSLSTALAAELTGGAIKTFTLTYADGSGHEGKDDDRRWAKWVAERYGTEHHEETVTFSNFPDSLRQVIRCFDEPFCGTISTFFLAPLIAKHVKVALSGDGADELFGSYLSHRLAFPAANYARYAATGDRSLLKPFDGNPDFVACLAEEPDWQWRARQFVFSEQEKRSLFNLNVQQGMIDAGAHLKQCFTGLTARDPLNRVLEAEFRTIFPDQVLAFVDRLSMAHSLEVRSAFLDTAFVEYVASLPGRLKIKDGETKYILKQAALRYFPKEMVYRKKEGFVMPITNWLTHDLKDYVMETLSATRLDKHGLLDGKFVDRTVQAIYAGAVDYTVVNKVLSLIVFQEWFELYMEQPALTLATAVSPATVATV